MKCLTFLPGRFETFREALAHGSLDPDRIEAPRASFLPYVQDGIFPFSDEGPVFCAVKGRDEKCKYEPVYWAELLRDPSAKSGWSMLAQASESTNVSPGVLLLMGHANDSESIYSVAGPAGTLVNRWISLAPSKMPSFYESLSLWAVPTGCALSIFRRPARIRYSRFGSQARPAMGRIQAPLHSQGDSRRLPHQYGESGRGNTTTSTRRRVTGGFT